MYKNPYCQNTLLAHLAKGKVSLWDGAASVVRPSTFSFKRLLLQNH